MSFSEKIKNLTKCMNKLCLQEEKIESIIDKIVLAYSTGNKVIVFGNGGSASDALHMCGELSGRFFLNRSSLPAVCLNANVSTMTAVANDFGYDEVFRKQLEGLLVEGDVVIGISTSGNSGNVLKAMKYAKDNNGVCVSFLGKDGGKIKDLCDLPLIMPSDITPEIQEMHIQVIHYICEMVENRIFGEDVEV